jgi:pimeloyl-ACP methyl ester carboxylesterase
MSRRHSRSTPRSRRAILAVAGAATLATTAVPAVALGASDEGRTTVSAATGASHSAPKPTVVLVHGAWVDSSSWSQVIDRLQAQAYPVQAIANPLRGLASDATYVKSRIESVKGPIVLVGHSYGGATISAAAAKEPNVKALVYVAAFAPDKGETIGALAAKDPGSHASPDALNPVPFDLGNGATGTDIYIKPDKYRDVFAGTLSHSRANSLAAVQRAHQRCGSGGDRDGRRLARHSLLVPGDVPGPCSASGHPALHGQACPRAHHRGQRTSRRHVTRPDTVTSLIRHAATATR